MVAFFDSWPAKRIWPVDMAGFAVNINHLEKYPNASMPYKAGGLFLMFNGLELSHYTTTYGISGYEEDAFLKSIGLKIEEIEPKANDCTEVFVWHTQTTKTKAPIVKIARDLLEHTKSNLLSLLNTLSEMGVSHFSSSGGRKAI